MISDFGIRISGWQVAFNQALAMHWPIRNPESEIENRWRYPVV